MEDIKDTLGCRYYEYMESVMGVYMEVDDYRNAILIFSDEPELRMLIEAYEAINYDDDDIIDNLKGMLNLNVSLSFYTIFQKRIWRGRTLTES